MSVANDMSLVSLITGASLPVQLVMAILLITSLFSWWYIFIKVATIKRAESESNCRKTQTAGHGQHF
jgi:biopolymer transport protein TolQ